MEKSRDSGVSVSWVIILSFVCDKNDQLNYSPNVLRKENIIATWIQILISGKLLFE